MLSNSSMTPSSSIAGPASERAFEAKILNKTMESAPGWHSESSCFKRRVRLLVSLHRLLGQMSEASQTLIFADATDNSSTSRIDRLYRLIDMCALLQPANGVRFEWQDGETEWLVQRAIVLRFLHAWKCAVRPVYARKSSPRGILGSLFSNPPESAGFYPYFVVLSRRLFPHKDAAWGRGSAKALAVDPSKRLAWKKWRLLFAAKHLFHPESEWMGTDVGVLRQWRVRARQKHLESKRKHSAFSLIRRIAAMNARLAAYSQAAKRVRLGQKIFALMCFRVQRAHVQEKHARIFSEMCRCRAGFVRWRGGALPRVRRLALQAASLRWTSLARNPLLSWAEARVMKRQKSRRKRAVLAAWRTPQVTVLAGATRLHNRSLLQQVWVVMQARMMRRMHLGQQLEAFQQEIQLRALFNAWREQVRKTATQDKVIEEWQRTHLLRRCFSDCWRRSCRASWQASNYRCFIVGKQHLRIWHQSMQKSVSKRAYLRQYWDAWKRHVGSVRGMRFFFGKLALARAAPLDVHQIPTERASLDRFLNRRVCLQHWLSKTRKVPPHPKWVFGILCPFVLGRGAP